jgi:hypothetical protein
MANKIDTWRLWAGDYYHGNRAPGHLPVHDEVIDPVSGNELLFAILDYLGGGSEDLPPWGQDAKRFWNEEMHDEIHSFIAGYGLDEAGEEAYVFVASRKDIRLQAHSVMMGNNSYAGHIPGKTPAYSSAIIVRDILYPALIYANPNRDVTTSQLMNYPDCSNWRTNDGVRHQVCSARTLKDIFMSHGRKYEGHILWDAHLERLNDGASIMYYSGHGTGGSGSSAQYYQTDNCNYPDVIWPDGWRGYMYDHWKTPRDHKTLIWYNPEPPNLYDIVHFKWHDQLFDNLRSIGIFYMSCSTGQQFGPLVYLDHGALMWYGNAGSGLCPEADLMDDWFFEDALEHGIPVGRAYSEYIWLHYRDFTTGDPTAMYGSSSLYGGDGITTVHCIYGDPNLIIYSPEWTSPQAIDSNMEPNNAPPLAPTITGPKTGAPEKSLTFNYVTTDPNGDQIEYYVVWGDDTSEDWEGPFNSGQGSSASHAWSSQGIYTIKVKARDSHGLEGPWGTHSLTVSKSRVRTYNTIYLQIIERIVKSFPLLEQILIRLLNI